MDASVVIPTKNGGNRFIDVLATVAGQVTNYDYEIICVDSGSSDFTLEVIAAFPEVTLYEIPPSEFGHGKTRSWAAEKCSGDYIIFITQDALPTSPYWLQSFINAMKAAPDAIAGFGIHRPYPECNFIDARNISNHFKQYGDEDVVVQVEDFQQFEEDLAYRMRYAFFSDNNACVHRGFFLEHPYPDVNFAEDQFWMMEQMGKGYKKVYTPNAAVYHSHNYGVAETMQRAFDEHRALRRLFGWCSAPNGRRIPIDAWNLTKDDWKYIASLNAGVLTKAKAIATRPFINAAKLLGMHEGCVYDDCDPRRQRRMDAFLSQLKRQTTK